MTYVPFFLVMAVPPGPACGRPEDKLHVTAIHVLRGGKKDVDGRVSAFGRPGHDEKGYSKLCTLGGG